MTVLCKNQSQINSHLISLRGADFQRGGGYIGVVPRISPEFVYLVAAGVTGYDLVFTQQIMT